MDSAGQSSIFYHSSVGKINRRVNWLLTTQRGNYVLLFLMFVVALTSKIPGFTNELPPYVFCDEAMWSGTVQRALNSGTLSLDEFRAGGLNVYPVLSPLLVLNNLFNFSISETQIILFGRFLLTGVLGSSTLFLLYGITNQITKNKITSLIAALCFVISPFSFSLSQYWYPDHYIYFFSAAFLYFLIRNVNSGTNGSKWVWLYMGIFGGLAASVKYTGILLFALVPIALMIQFVQWTRAKPLNKAITIRVLKNIFICILGCLLTIILFNWSAILQPETFFWGFEFNQKNYSHDTLNWPGVPFYLASSYLLTLPPLGCVFFVIGYFALFRINRSIFSVMILFPVGFIIFLGTALTILNRNMSLLIPFLFPIAAIGIVSTYKYALSLRQLFRISLILLILGSLVGSTYLTALGLRNDLSGDSRVAASRWLEANISREEIVGINWSCAGPSPAAAVGLYTVEDGMMEKGLNFYVLDSYWTPNYLSPAYRSIGLLQNPLQKYVHFYNSFSDSRLYNFSADIPSIEELASLKGYRVLKTLNGAGPQIVILFKTENSMVK